MSSNHDAVLVVSFGGPDGPNDVVPFLENVLRGRNVPRERMLQVAEHYYQFGGVSPINAQNRALIAALVNELNGNDIQIPVYWGNRNWHPMLADTLRQMADDGVSRALAFFTSPYSSYSGCRQYLDNIEQARQEVGSQAPQVDKLRAYFNHPGFIDAMVDRVEHAMREIPDERKRDAQILFTAHSIPASMADNCSYATQLAESSGLVAEAIDNEHWRLVYQSRSGPPTQPWLEPDVCSVLEEIGQQRSTTDIIIAPIGFISDHMEVIYDLDVEAQAVCARHELNMIRAGTVGTHPRFVEMIRDLIVERTSEQADRAMIGSLGPSHDVCPADCCRYK